MRLILGMKGRRFGRFTVLEKLNPKIHSYVEYKCVCDCGNIRNVRTNHLISGASTSCGCYQKENASKIHSKGYDTKSKEYKIWCGIKKRCYNKSVKCYHYYGAMGISVCDEWLHSYENFIRDMGKCPQGLNSIDRIDNSKGYSKSNCRWADSIIQANNRCSNIYIEYKNEIDTLSNLCRKYNKNYKLVHRRIRNGLDIDSAFDLPTQRSTKKLTLLSREHISELITHFKTKKQ